MPNSFRVRVRRRLFREDLTHRLAAAARLRNLLVHRYWIIDEVM
ncbi:hypothetical protein DRO59_08025 [Candidatus Bathyarchaeota archaeon]|nr:MAG: hypothetical protein DRO59_08025 [Candidatus Bathyarchaeota archaeon]